MFPEGESRALDAEDEIVASGPRLGSEWANQACGPLVMRGACEHNREHTGGATFPSPGSATTAGCPSRARRLYRVKRAISGFGQTAVPGGCGGPDAGACVGVTTQQQNAARLESGDRCQLGSSRPSRPHGIARAVEVRHQIHSCSAVPPPRRSPALLCHVATGQSPGRRGPRRARVAGSASETPA